MKDFASSVKVVFVNGHLAMGKLEDMDMIIGEKMDPAVIHKTGQSTNSPFFIAERKKDKLYQRQTCQKENMRKIDIRGSDTIWDCVDREHSLLTIDKSLNRYRKKDYGFTNALGSTKNDTGI